MKLLLTTDHHVDATTAGVARRPELLEHHARLREICREKKVDAAAFLGDWCDPGHMLGPLYARDAVREFRALAAETRFGKLIAIAGNHDVVEASVGGEPVTTLSHLEALDCVVLAEEPAFHVFPQCPRVGFLLLPYVARAHQVARPGLVAAVVDNVLRVESAGGRVPDRIVVLSHLTVPGARLGSESRELSRGRDVDLPYDELERLRSRIYLVANGHYHARQVVKSEGRPDVLVPGAPLRLTFAEQRDSDDPSRGCVVVEV